MLSWLFLIATHHRDVLPKTVVGCEYPVIPGEIDSGFGHQGGQAGDEVEGFQHNMGRSIMKRGKKKKYSERALQDETSTGLSN